MKQLALIAAFAALTGCSPPATPAAQNATAGAPAAAAAPAPAPIDAAALPSQIRVLAAHGSDAAATAAALEQWLDEQIAPKKIPVTVVNTPEDALIRDLLAGKGEVAANLLLSFERDDQVAFARPIVTGIREVIVTGAKEHPLVSLEDAGRHRIYVRKASDHYASLIRLNEQLVKIARRPAQIVIAPATQTDEDLIKQVSAGTIPATIAYDYQFRACCSSLPGLNVNTDIAVSQDGSLSWVTRKDAPQLLAVLNGFFSHRVP
jgi:membrane-bound lytic murein transglycosylase MltF